MMYGVNLCSLTRWWGVCSLHTKRSLLLLYGIKCMKKIIIDITISTKTKHVSLPYWVAAGRIITNRICWGNNLLTRVVVAVEVHNLEKRSEHWRSMFPSFHFSWWAKHSSLFLCESLLSRELQQRNKFVSRQQHKKEKKYGIQEASRRIKRDKNHDHLYQRRKLAKSHPAPILTVSTRSVVVPRQCMFLINT